MELNAGSIKPHLYKVSFVFFFFSLWESVARNKPPLTYQHSFFLGIRRHNYEAEAVKRSPVSGIFHTFLKY